MITKTFDNGYEVNITEGEFDKYGKIYAYKIEVIKNDFLAETHFVNELQQAIDTLFEVSYYRTVSFNPFKK